MGRGGVKPWGRLALVHDDIMMISYRSNDVSNGNELSTLLANEQKLLFDCLRSNIPAAISGQSY